MAKHVVILRDKRKGTLTEALLLQHVDHLRTLHQNGRLHMCGPFANNDGAFLLIEGESLEEVKSTVAGDPFIRQGYYRSFEVHELIESGPFNNWLLDDSQTRGNMSQD